MVDAFSITISLEEFPRVARNILELIGRGGVEIAYGREGATVAVIHVAEPLLEQVVRVLVEKQVGVDDFFRKQVTNAIGVLRQRLERLSRVAEMIK